MQYKWTRSLLLLAEMAGLFSLVQVASAQSTPKRSLLALSKRNHTLAIVDPTTLEVVTRLPVGPDPHEVIASSDGTKAYVSIYGGGRYHALSVLDLMTQKALPDIDTGALRGPHGLAFVGGKVWFTAEAGPVRSSNQPDRLDPGYRPESNAHALRYPRREKDLHHKCQLRDGQRS